MSSDLENMFKDIPDDAPAETASTTVEEKDSTTVTPVAEDTSFKAAVKKNGKINLFEDPVAPLQIDKSEYKTLARTFLVFSDGKNIPEEVKMKMKVIAEKLKSLEFILRSPADRPDDELLTAATHNMGKDNTYNYLTFLNKKKPVPFRLSSPSEKAYGLLFGFFATKPKDVMTYSGGYRSRLARDYHLLLGDECNTPIKLMVVYDEFGHDGSKQIDFDDIKKKDAEAGRENYFRTVPGYILKRKQIESENAKILIINLANADAAEKFKQFVEKF